MEKGHFRNERTHALQRNVTYAQKKKYWIYSSRLNGTYPWSQMSTAQFYFWLRSPAAVTTALEFGLSSASGLYCLAGKLRRHIFIKMSKLTHTMSEWEQKSQNKAWALTRVRRYDLCSDLSEVISECYICYIWVCPLSPLICNYELYITLHSLS